ncbi:two component transcriptional regulator, LytTR family [Filimonas lacunae]|uniref:Two component transcriptional regulator, LytTR family n=1 Tax=Filimonas lacunae TaxID=477680 RepID=A0A173MHL5_9BACT|nr:LytTR family DNA-binding domain-containing protein [Filimonas lacunae]BAV06989.1 autolysis response regulater LytR [Filimonas lacunae]SIS96791.1 two component transcriptional regulator, LytTR family [Filimonas lacunae]
MNILILEDEMRIARRLTRMTKQYFEYQPAHIELCDALPKGLAYLEKHPVDLLLLDLNLNGEDGFDVLQAMVSRSFHTIIVSAHTDKAITAFAYGVLDFVPKPFDVPRLFKAFDRLRNTTPAPEQALQHLAVRTAGTLKLIPLASVQRITGAGNYSELLLFNGHTELHDKSLDTLEQLLPHDQFVRIHRSYITRWQDCEKLLIEPGGRYSLQLKNGELLPVGRSRYKELRNQLG